jgi:hypothetical protein
MVTIYRLSKNQQGFHITGAVVAILVLCLVGFTGFFVYKQTNGPSQANGGNSHGPKYKALAACGSKPLTTLPADLSQLEHIAPLGGVNTPDHTLPTDHMYMMYPYGDTSQKEVYAPADVIVTAVSFGTETGPNLIKPTSDYTISFYPCRELKLIYGHIDTLDGRLKAAIGSAFDKGIGCTSSTQGTSKITHCAKDVDITIPAGELLGSTDGWDLWATYDGRVDPHVTSPAYYHNVDAVCPLDYFTDSLQAQLYSLVKRPAKPVCGEAYQDKANSLQGGWFAHKDPTKAKTDWSSHFSLTHHSQEPDVGMVAVAGTIADHFMYRFTPRSSGTINREPAQTTKGTLYCYQHEGPQRMPNGTIAGTGKVLIKLLSNHQAQIEHVDGSCTGSEAFTKPTTYYR